VLGNGVKVGNWLDHLNVELFLSIRESGLEHDKVVTIESSLKVYTLGERRHLASSQVNTTLDFPRTIAELENV
jgi:hypothetical protein